ncbi:hypothetical protein JQN58_03890 [Aneurinibacillus sp. BA2021]|nr:hypothetical protein [Aneurinibacillus sp. BA2021]
MLFVILPVFFFQVFFVEKLFKNPGWHCKAIVGACAAVSIILCMTFPFTFLPGYIFDMRAIPMVIATLYCGYEAGLFSLLVLLAYRYYLGGDGFYTTFYIYPLITGVCLLIAPRFRAASSEKREVWAMWTAIFVSALIIFFCLLYLPDEQKMRLSFLQFSLQYALIQMAGMWMGVYLVENMYKSLRMQQEIQQAEKLYAMGELAASVAHEIRNPLTVVRGFIQLFGQQQITLEKRQDYIKIMLEELNRAEEIISDYLTFARPQAEKRERIVIGERLEQIVGVMNSYAMLSNVQICVEAEPELEVKLDRSQFSQCLINLMKNAVEAMPQGGVLSVRATRHGDRVIIEVSDTGKGMGIQEIERLGRPFYSTKEKGTGLGLMVCYRIVEAWGGDIKVQSEKGKGTCFSIRLPLHKKR